MFIIGIFIVVVVLVMYVFMSFALLNQLFGSITEAERDLAELLAKRIAALQEIVALTCQFTPNETMLKDKTEAAAMAIRAVEQGEINQLAAINEETTHVFRIVTDIGANIVQISTNPHFLELFHHIEDITYELQKSLHYYNNMAYVYNEKLDTFPLSLIAKYKNYQLATYFTGDELVKE